MEIIPVQEENNEATYMLPVKYNNIYEIVGWGSSILILVVYINPFDDVINLSFNIIGSLGLIVPCINKRAYQPMVINVAWVIGSFYKYFS
jgi:hypothetical protein|tara:strand:- start:385 stop:654 length:270 start_codon:yes stop_codon:yes gene_type:complete